MAAEPADGGSGVAKRRWELENEVKEVEDIDELLRWNPEQVQAQLQKKPWSKDNHFFKKVKISALALLKMAIHAKSGGRLEVMGMVQGKVMGDTFVVVDAFALPVEGTETRVNAHDQAYEFMVNFQATSNAAGRKENVCGWYHSHPGYGCWLSGIDVGTQMEQQQFQDPFVAIVVDPVKTAAAGKVEIGAFRTYPKGYTPPESGPSQYQTIPLDKIEEFGIHAKHYYALEVSFFKSKADAHFFDLMWSKYWAATLSSDPLASTQEFLAAQMKDLCRKLDKESTNIGSGVQAFAALEAPHCHFPDPQAVHRRENRLKEAAKDAGTFGVEILKGLASQRIKQEVFHSV